MKTLKSLQKFGWLPVLLLTAQLSHGQDVNATNLRADMTEQNTGSLGNAGGGTSLRFGNFNSGEGIASKRNAGGNQYGLDFYTNFTNRLAITGMGNVGIGTTTPTQTLDVNGGILARAFGPISNQGAYLQWNRTRGEGETWLLNQKGGGNSNAGIRFGSATSGNVVTEWARFLDNGNFGIGTTAPISQLANTATNIIGTDGRGTNAQSINWLMDNQGYTAAFANTGAGNNNNGLAVKVANTNSVALDVSQNALMSAGGTSLLCVNSNGTVGIGTASPAALLDVAGNTRLMGAVLIGLDITRFNTALTNRSTYGLWVEKGVVANDFAIAAPATWADFVFAPGYRLPSLAETERYIQQHGHLPQMPSADEVKKDGYTLHEMNTRLLQKVEELTLHAIEQEKQLAETRALLQPYAQLAAEVASLKAKLDK